MSEVKNWGGKREGAGRPALAGEVRKLRSMRATDDEWRLIQQFAKLLKHGDKLACVEFLNPKS